MAEAFVGEIRQFGGNFAPQGWMFCNGQILNIADNDVLFTLIGTTYGGNGTTTFALPNLQGRVPIHQGSGFVLGQPGGAEQVTLIANQLPAHTHTPVGSDASGSDAPANNVWGASTTKMYAAAPGSLTMNPASVNNTGGNQPHDNMQPFVAVSYIISLFGIYPSQN